MKQLVCMALALLLPVGSSVSAVWTPMTGAAQDVVWEEPACAYAAGPEEANPAGTADPAEDAGVLREVHADPEDTDTARLLEGGIVLSAPEELGWDRDYRFTLSDYNRSRELENEEPADYAPLPGMIYWSLGDLTQNAYALNLYKVNDDSEEDGDTLIESAQYWKTEENSGYTSSFRFLWEQRDSGDYYFTLQARGDGIVYDDSAIARSPVFTYSAPMRSLDPPVRPIWGSRRFATITAVESDYVLGYRAQWFFTRDPNNEEEPIIEAGNVMQFHPNSVEFRVPESMLTQYGSGYYAVQVCALSNDMMGMSASGWSERSRFISIVSEYRTVSDIVAGVTEKSLPEDKQRAIENVRAMDTKVLSDALATDQKNVEAALQLRKLEEITGNQSLVAVSDDLADVFDVTKASIIGAGLNLDLGGSATLQIGKPEEENVLPSLYRHSLQFSMHLADQFGDPIASGGEDLEIPVKVTLPIPDTIRPELLILLHYHEDGSCEQVRSTYIHSAKEQWYVTFVLHNFSDFTMAERMEDVEARVTDGGVVLTCRFRNKEGRIASACCALYDEAGRQTGITALPVSEEWKTLAIPCKKGDAASVRIFTQDREGRPVTQALIPVIENAP